LRVAILSFVSLLFWASSREHSRRPAEVIEDQRDEKTVRLWPERESPLVNQVNGLVERGLREGAESGHGANGAQLVIGGMRSGQGASFGVGYRRSDLWRERLGYRATVRGTLQLAYMLDFELDFKSLGSKSSFVHFYAKYEHSPQMDYYGQGSGSLEEDRSSYLLDDFTTEGNFGFQPFRNFRASLTTDGSRCTLAPVIAADALDRRLFIPENTPGLGQDTDFFRFGAFFAYDYRDFRSGPKSGGFYGVRYRVYNDIDLDLYGFRQTELEFQQYFPYFNGTRVIAQLASTLSFARTDRVPICSQRWAERRSPGIPAVSFLRR
jgi:hypothetical protein